METSSSTTSGMGFGGAIENFLTAGGLGDDVDAGLRVEQAPDPFAEERVIVCQENTDHRGTLLPDRKSLS